MTSEIERSEKRKKPRVRGYVVEEIWVELLQSRVSKMKQTIQGFIQVLRRKCYLGAMLSASILFPWALGILKKGGVVHVVLLVVVVVRDTAGRLSMRQQLDAAEMALASPSTARRSSRATSTSRPYHKPATTPSRTLIPSSHPPHTQNATMDSLVAQYSRPADADEGPSEQEQLELYSGTPELSLKFALPPVAQVYYMYYCIQCNTALTPHSQHHGCAQ
jgi:hypothetical protein